MREEMMASNFYYYGRSDSLIGLIPNPFRYASSKPQDYNDYMNGYNSVSKLEKISRNEILEMLNLFGKNGKK